MTTLTGELREHTKFSPSRSERFFLCPGSVNLIDRVPPRERTTYSATGDVAHKVLQTGLETFSNTATEAVANSIYFCEQFSPDFLGSVTDALQYVWALMADVNVKYGDAVLYVETRVNPPISSAPGEAAGFCDIAVYSARARRLWVIDYKHGEGIAKAVLGNTQVKQYAAGFLYDDSINVNPQDVDVVTLVIIQPRAFHPDGDIREYDTTPLELVDYLIELDAQIEQCLDPSAPLIPGVDQCRFCDARSSCPALEARSLSVINEHFKEIRHLAAPKLPDPRTLDVQRLSYIKNSFELLRVWMNGVDTHIDELVRGGQAVPGWKLVEVAARREWEGEEEDRARKLAAYIGCKPEELYRTSFKTITDVEDMMTAAFKSRVGKGRKKQAAEEAKQIFAYFTTKQSSGNLVLAPEDDPRPAINKALQAFDGIRHVFIEPPTTTGEQK